MSKKAREVNRIKRLAIKRAKKQANREKYQALRDSGQNSKSKRFLKFLKKHRLHNILKHKHPQIPCGNPACKKCY